MSRTAHHHHRRMRWHGPNWWHHMFGTRRQRAKISCVVRSMVRLIDIEDAPELPDARKNRRGFYW